MNIKQEIVSIATVTSGGIGSQSLQVSGSSQPIPNIGSGLTRQTGERLLVLFPDDDNPIVIGDSGYMVSGG